MAKLFFNILKKYDKQIKFIQCNFRVVLTIAFIIAVIIAYIFIYNHPLTNNLSSNMRFAVVFSLVTTVLLLLVILKTLRDIIAIKLQNKGKGSLIEKTSGKRK